MFLRSVDLYLFGSKLNSTLDLKQLIYIFDLSASVFFCFCFFGLEMGVLQICTLQESTFQDWLKNKRWKYL